MMMMAATAKIAAQQIIEFEALSELFHILKQEDVNKTLDEKWEGGDFIALISDDVTEIGKSAFTFISIRPHII